MIKIGPLVATDHPQIVELLPLQEEPVVDVTPLTQIGLVLRSFTFWQHWLPCHYHIASSVYVAREHGQVLGLISLHNANKAKSCWKVDHLIVHPEHRGRGIAQELLRYVFALFGSQGVNHFVAEVSNHNEAAMSLFAACGFRRSSRVTYYRLSDKSRNDPELPDTDEFHVARPAQKQGLYQLHQDVLPPDLRLVLSQGPDDYMVSEVLPYTSVERSKHKLMRKRVWFWVSEDVERRTITSAVKVTAEPELGYRLDFAVHPGWKQMAPGLVNYAVNSLIEGVPQLPVWDRVYDFQPDVAEALKARGFERSNETFLLAREHWQRSRRAIKRKGDATVPLRPLGNPAINFPLATERKTISD